MSILPWKTAENAKLVAAVTADHVIASIHFLSRTVTLGAKVSVQIRDSQLLPFNKLLGKDLSWFMYSYTRQVYLDPIVGRNFIASNIAAAFLAFSILKELLCTSYTV